MTNRQTRSRQPEGASAAGAAAAGATRAKPSRGGSAAKRARKDDVPSHEAALTSVAGAKFPEACLSWATWDAEASAGRCALCHLTRIEGEASVLCTDCRRAAVACAGSAVLSDLRTSLTGPVAILERVRQLRACRPAAAADEGGAERGAARESGRKRAAPASAASAAPAAGEAPGEDCVICQEPLASAATVELEGCSHSLHVACAVRWFRRARARGRCPLCQTAPAQSDDDDESGDEDEDDELEEDDGLSEEEGDDDDDVALHFGSFGAPAPVSDDALATVMGMGFSRELATVALQGAGGNVEVAVNRLLAQPTPADGAARSDAAEVVVDDD